MTNWVCKVDIKQHLSDDTSNKAVRIASGKILAELRAKLLSKWSNPMLPEYCDYSLLYILDDLVSMSQDTDVTCEDFNYVLSDLYDWADRERVWLGL